MYEHNMNETWKIEAEICNKVILRFTSFDLESCCDYVKVYECDVNRLLGSFNGEELPPEVRSIGNCISIIMTTDGSVTKAGFSANIYKFTP
ncbi:tolloid-like protein 2 [Mytilus trossulus]|uniref:tolloid-like protein 2 n=1 Tax=Mytilus trossulus TaxID=6551 RepID=UPI003003D965